MFQSMYGMYGTYYNELCLRNDENKTKDKLSPGISLKSQDRLYVSLYPSP